MIYVEALNTYYPYPNEISLFLGGGISNCVNWQDKMVELLSGWPQPGATGPELVLLNPRRKHFPMDDPSATDGQIRWEYDHMRQATAIMFWFSPETLCPITLFELGKWIETKKPLFVGCDPAYQRIQDVIVQCSLSRPSMGVCTDLQTLANRIIEWAG